MKFRDLVNEYETMLNILSIHQQRARKSVDWIMGAYWSSSVWFKNLKNYCEDFPKLVSLSDDESKLYIDYDTKEKASFKLNYRDNIIPIWLDDAGQQLYTIYKNTLFTTGSYSICPEIILSDQIDTIIDKEFLDL